MSENLTNPDVVLFATDGSAGAELAGKLAGAIAGTLGAELHVAHAWSKDQVYGPLPASAAPLPGTAEERGERVLEDAVDILTRSGATVSGMHLRQGNPSDTILTLADEVGAGIVVLGRRGTGGMTRVLIGSVSQTVAARSRVAVMVVPPTAAGVAPHLFVVGDDGSPDAVRALEFAALLATACDVDLVACRALPSPADVPARERAAVLDDLVIGTTEDLRARVSEAGGRPPRREGLVQVVLGDPAETLDNRQRGDRDVWLVVGRRGAARASTPFGSVSARLARNAIGPLLIVPPTAPLPGAAHSQVRAGTSLPA